MCGQRVDVGIPTAVEWLAEIADEVGSLNSRLATTVSSVFLRPWALVLDWAEGRRAGIISPVRLYLLGIALWGGFLALGQISFGPEGTEGGMLGQAAISAGGGSISRVALAALGPIAVLFLPVSYAVWSRFAFGSSPYPFGIHVITSLYLHAFLMLLVAPWVLATGFMLVFLDLNDSLAVALFFGGVGAALWVHAMNFGRRVFGRGATGSMMRAFLALVLHGATVALAVVIYGWLFGARPR